MDRFHIVQLVGRALDQVRISTLKSINDKRSREYKSLKLHWRMYHLFEDELDQSNIKFMFGLNEYMTQQNLVDIGTGVNRSMNLVYETYQKIIRAIKSKDSTLLNETLKDYTKINSSMDTAISTLKRNLKYIENSCELPYSNGPLEGLIGKIKKLKHNCYGFRNLKHFFIRIRLILA